MFCLLAGTSVKMNILTWYNKSLLNVKVPPLELQRLVKEDEFHVVLVKGGFWEKNRYGAMYENNMTKGR